MYQSIPSLTILPGKPLGNLFERVNPHPSGTKKVRNSEPWGRKIVLKPHPRINYFEISSKKQQNMNETEIMENSTKMLICLKHLKAQSFMVGGFYGYSKYLKSFSIHL